MRRQNGAYYENSLCTGFLQRITQRTTGVRTAEAGSKKIFPDCSTVSIPVSDGGEGAVEILIPSLQGKIGCHNVHGPLGNTVSAQYGIFHKNCMLIEMAAASGGKLRACMALNPSLVNLGLPGEGTPVERLKALRPSAVRVFPDEQKFLFNSFYASDILDACQELHMPVIVTKAYDDMFIHDLPDVCEKYPDVPIILPRFGQNKSRYYFPILKKLPNVYLDMSIMLDVASIEEICQRFGSERLVFGSALPNYEPSGAYGLLFYANISQQEKENIAHANFERLEGGIRYDD